MNTILKEDTLSNPLETTIVSLVETNNILKSDKECVPNNIAEDYIETYDIYMKKVRSLEVPIIETIQEDAITNFKYFNERYFTNKYHMCVFLGGEKKGYGDILVRVHTNKLVLLALASGNDIYKSDKKIVNINFIINKSDRSRIKTQGKRKRGAKQIVPDTILCQVTLEGEDEHYNIRAGISCHLIEINELIKKDPNLLKSDPKGLGYLAIVFPKGPVHDFEQTIDSWNLKNEEDYLKEIKIRPVEPDKYVIWKKEN